jgi:hypothetical protein
VLQIERRSTGVNLDAHAGDEHLAALLKREGGARQNTGSALPQSEWDNAVVIFL